MHAQIMQLWLYRQKHQTKGQAMDPLIEKLTEAHFKAGAQAFAMRLLGSDFTASEKVHIATLWKEYSQELDASIPMAQARTQRLLDETNRQLDNFSHA